MPKIVEQKNRKIELIGVRVDREFKQKVEEIAKNLNVSVSDFIRLVLQNKIENIYKKGN